MDRILREAIKPSEYCRVCHEVCMDDVVVDGLDGIWGTCSAECLARWIEIKKEQRLKYQREYRARHGGGWAKLRFTVLQRDGFRCVYCGATAQDGGRLEVDHVIPRSKGGEDSQDNLVTSCRWCNLGKSDVLLARHGNGRDGV